MASLMPIKSLSEVTSKWLEGIFKASIHDSIKVQDVSFENSYTSDGFLSDIAFCTVLLEDEREKKELSIVVKTLPSNEEMQGLLLNLKLAPIEASFNSFLTSKSLSEFVQKKAVKLPIPNLYYSSFEANAFTLVMDNVSTQGFTRVLDPNGIDLSTTLKAIRAVATIHAVMLAYFEKNSPEQLKLIIKQSDNIDLLEELLGSGFKHILKVISNIEICNKVEGLISSGKLKNYFRSTASTIPATFIHGDYWTGQVLYSEGDACILDWQFVDYANPLDDISSFLFMSCNASVFASLGSIVESYVNTLNSTLAKLESSLNVSQKEVMDHLHHSWRKGFATLIASLETFLSNDRINVERLEGILLLALEKGILDIN